MMMESRQAVPLIRNRPVILRLPMPCRPLWEIGGNIYGRPCLHMVYVDGVACLHIHYVDAVSCLHIVYVDAMACLHIVQVILLF